MSCVGPRRSRSDKFVQREVTVSVTPGTDPSCVSLAYGEGPFRVHLAVFRKRSECLFMKPSELAEFRFTGKLPSPELPSPVELEGKLIASGNLSHLIDSDTPGYSPDPCFGVLLPDGLIDRLGHLPIPLLVGSSVNFVGYATFICDVWQTGYYMLPYRMTQVYSFTYEDKYVGKHSLHVSHMPHDVYINANQHWDAGALKSLLPYFERKFTIMELRKHLNARGHILLHRSLEGERLSDVEKILKELGVRYELRRVPKGND